MHANTIQGPLGWHNCCISCSILLFLCCISCHSPLFHSIPADVWWMLWQNVYTEHYWFLTSPLKRPAALIGQVGSMSHLCVFRLSEISSTMWSHHLRKLSALITGREEWGHCPALCWSYHWEAIVMKQICSSRLQ